MYKTLLVNAVRLKSTRVKEKLLQTVGNNPLINICIKKLMELSGVDIAFLATSDMCPYISQTIVSNKWTYLEQVEANNWYDLIKPHLEFLSKYQTIIDCNFVCHPFLKLETIKQIIKLSQNTNQPFTITTPKRGIVWSETKKILGEGELANTTKNPVYYELAHLAYVYPTAYLRYRDEQLGRMVKMVPIELEPEERIDIDYPRDLEFARMYCDGYRAKFGRLPYP